MPVKPTAEVGYAQQIITPALLPPVYLAGFGQNRVAQSIHDDLYVRVLAIHCGGECIALVALDLLGLSRHHCQEIENTVNSVQPNTHVIIACTHVHHGPDTLGLWGPDDATSGVNAAYITHLKHDIVATVQCAIENCRLAELRCSSVVVTGVAKNARNPEIRDEELSCLQFCEPITKKAIVTWLIFPCHPEVLWDNNPHITSDYVYRLREKVESATGAPTVFMVGALGGMMTPDVRDHSFEEAITMGTILARAALHSLEDIEALPIGRISVSRRELAIPLQSLLLEQALNSGLLEDNRNEHGELVTEVSLLQIGSCWLATIPGELLPKLGLQIKAELKQAGAEMAVVVGLANDEIGYILPQEDYIYPDNPFEPGNHYEETMSVGPEAAVRLIAALRHLLETVQIQN